MYSITDRMSFESIEKWLQEVREYAPQNVSIILVGSDCDNEEKRMVSFNEGKSFAQKHGIDFLEVRVWHVRIMTYNLS